MEEVETSKIYTYLKSRAEVGDQNDLFLFAFFLHSDTDRFDEAYLYYDRAAKKGHVYSKIMLFLLNTPPNDTVSNPNKSEGLKWLTQAANEGCTGAQVMLGTIYFEAAKEACTGSQVMSGTIYIDGEDFSQFYTTSFKWFMTSSSNYLSQLNLAIMYEQGLGVPKNKKSAIVWRLKSSQNKNKDSPLFEEEKVKVLDILKENASHGHAEDQYAIALYLEGRGRQYWPDASSFYQLSADQGHLLSQIQIMQAHMFGHTNADGEPNIYSGLKYAEMAANQGHVDSQMIMADFYFRGIGIEKNLSTAFIWFEKAAHNDIANAQNMLGQMYSEGVGVEKNESQSIEWYKRAKANAYDIKRDPFSPLFEASDDENSDDEGSHHLSPSSSLKKEKKVQSEECSNCGKIGHLKSCARCQLIKYCSTACQRQHWKAIGGHKKFCVSKEERKSVLTSKNSNNASTRAESRSVCSICIEEILKGPTSYNILLHSCRHEFHVQCFISLCESEYNRCPVCRVEINVIHRMRNEKVVHVYEKES